MCPSALREVSVLAEPAVGRLRSCVAGAPPQPNSPPGRVPARPGERGGGGRQGVSGARPPLCAAPAAPPHRPGLESSSKGSSCPAGRHSPVPESGGSRRRGSGQWDPRWSIHARRKLPDEAFGYLKRVIVTPAVYQGLGGSLHGDCRGTGQKSRRASAGCGPRDAMFLINSRDPRVRSSSDPARRQSHSFSRGYGAGLPTSLSRVRSRARGC